jgi:hypothetical protein
VDLLSFAGIWLALAIFSIDTLIAFGGSVRAARDAIPSSSAAAGAGVAEI